MLGALVAGSGLGGLALWQRRHFIPGFQEKSGLLLPSYSLVPDKLLPEMAIAHGSEHEKVISAAIGALGGMGRFISNGDIVVIKPNSVRPSAGTRSHDPPGCPARCRADGSGSGSREGSCGR